MLKIEIVIWTYLWFLFSVSEPYLLLVLHPLLSLTFPTKKHKGYKGIGNQQLAVAGGLTNFEFIWSCHPIIVMEITGCIVIPFWMDWWTSRRDPRTRYTYVYSTYWHVEPPETGPLQMTRTSSERRKQRRSPFPRWTARVGLHTTATNTTSAETLLLQAMPQCHVQVVPLNLPSWFSIYSHWSMVDLKFMGVTNQLITRGYHLVRFHMQEDFPTLFRRRHFEGTWKQVRIKKRTAKQYIYIYTHWQE